MNVMILMFHLMTFDFVITDVLNNAEHLSENDIESLLLQKEKFWIGALKTQHKGLNDNHE